MVRLAPAGQVVPVLDPAELIRAARLRADEDRPEILLDISRPLTVLVGVVALRLVNTEPAPALTFGGLMIVMGLLLTAFGVMSFVGGLGLWRLDPKHRTLNTVVATVWLVTFWCFCPLGLWALYLLRSSAGAVVLSPKYAEARRRTPHIRFNSHRETARALALLVLGVTLVNLRAWLG